MRKRKETEHIVRSLLLNFKVGDTVKIIHGNLTDKQYGLPKSIIGSVGKILSVHNNPSVPTGTFYIVEICNRWHIFLSDALILVNKEDEYIK